MNLPMTGSRAQFLGLKANHDQGLPRMQQKLNFLKSRLLGGHVRLSAAQALVQSMAHVKIESGEFVGKVFCRQISFHQSFEDVHGSCESRQKHIQSFV